MFRKCATAAALALAAAGCGGGSNEAAIPTEVTPEQEKAMVEQQKVVDEQERQQFGKVRN